VDRRSNLVFDNLPPDAAKELARLQKSEGRLRHELRDARLALSNATVMQRPSATGRTALVKLDRNLLVTDAKPPKLGKQVPPKLGRAERQFNLQLRQVGAHVGQLVKGFEAGDAEALPRLLHLLRAYSDALTPWAVSAVRRMLGEVNDRDVSSWRSLGTAMGRQLHHDIFKTDVGHVMARLLHEQVGLIKSLPVEAGERVHELTLRGLENSERAASYADEIRRSGEVTKARATLIARTEVARTASILTQTRAMAAGITHYRWQTSEDADVRRGHAAMQGKVCRFDTPPAVEENGRIMHFHPGQIWNCRCWPEPLVDRRMTNDG
jgi:SPP1 gp7 family putative phage head morphogenesis protein